MFVVLRICKTFLFPLESPKLCRKMKPKKLNTASYEKAWASCIISDDFMNVWQKPMPH